MLLINFSLIKEAQIQYGNLALGEAVSIPLGLGLWGLGWWLRRSGSQLRRVGGTLALAVAASYTLGRLLLNGLVPAAALGLL